MPRRPISAANWKMNLSSAEAIALSNELAQLDDPGDVDVVVAPSPSLLPPVAAAFGEAPAIRVAGQNMHHADSGT